MFRPYCLGLFVCVAATLGAAPPEASLSLAKTAMASMPLRFEANQGQWKSDVRFAARAPGLLVAMTDRGPSLRFGADAGSVDIALAGSQAAARAEALDPMQARTDYFIGSRENWHTAVANYSRVRYARVYPGIDAVYYGNRNQLEYDFVLAPGADARAIRMQFRGAARVRITAAGDLSVETAAGGVLQKKPVVVQDGREIAARYILLAHNEVGLKLGRYNHARTLVVDPQLQLGYSTYVGGTLSDQVVAVKLDSQGRLYVVGATDTSDIVTLDGAYLTANAGGTDIFFLILDARPTGNYTLVYSSYIGGVSNDIPTAMTIDYQGNVYITGSTVSTNFPIVGNAIQSSGAGATSYAFVLELSPAFIGSDAMVYSTLLGGTTGNTVGNGVDLDSSGNIYVIGTTRASDFPVTASAYAGVNFGPQDAFLTEINPNSTSAVYSTFLGGELDDDGRGIAVAPNGLVYFAATTNSTQFPMEGNSYRNYLSGNNNGNTLANLDLVIGVMDMTKFGEPSLVYSTYLGGTSNDEVRKIAFDGQGNLLLTGYTLSTDFPTTKDAFQPAAGGNGDAFVLAVNPSKPPAGFIVYSTFLGGSDGEVGYDITTDAAGLIYVTGYTMSSDFPVKNAWQPAWGQGIDVFVTALKPGVAGKAALQYSTYIGGATVNSGYTVRVGPDGRIYVGGMTGGLWPELDGNLQGFGGGLKDGFVSVFSPQ